MQVFGTMPLLHLRENKQPIGRAEAQALLNLKITRGGPERLRLLQQTVRALLGVNIDAFAPESRSELRERPAEMDIDEFLVEVNGAGIREALRIILDLELKKPALALIEEPEVHLHPGLERALEGYIREKSREMQIFVTTHSTNFVDAAAFQNVYLVSRNDENTTVCEPLSVGDAAFKLPAELGLQLSTVFMFDGLVFVEGPSDEAVLRELATTLGVELARSNIGFVHMGGARNFAHYAAEHTLELLSRRQIRLFFVLDRDEAEDADIQAMTGRLGDRAKLVVHARRELENYLLDPEAVLAFIEEKRRVARRGPSQATADAIAEAIREEAEQLKDEVIRLRLAKKILGPVHLQRRGMPSDLSERLNGAIEDLNGRLQNLENLTQQVSQSVESAWPGAAMDLSPGSLVLERVSARYDVRFDKSSGHSAQIAALIPKDRIHADIHPLLKLLGR
jgi:hypothetical protein